MRCNGLTGFPGGLTRLLERPLRFTVGRSGLNGLLGRLTIVPFVFLHECAAHLHKDALGVLHFFGGKVGRFFIPRFTSFKVTESVVKTRRT